MPCCMLPCPRRPQCKRFKGTPIFRSMSLLALNSSDLCVGLQAVAVHVRHALQDDSGLLQLLLQLLRDCDSPEVLESVVAVLAALEDEETAAAIAQVCHRLHHPPVASPASQ